MATDKEIIDSLKTDWTADDFYHHVDLNRVETATNVVRNNLEDFRNTTIPLTIVTNRTQSSVEFSDSLNRIENNILTLSQNLDNRVEIENPKTDWSYNLPFAFNDANRLERNLEVIYNYIVLNQANIPYAGQYITGQGVI